MVGENGELMVELKNDYKAAELSICSTENFNDQILIAPWFVFRSATIYFPMTKQPLK